MATDSRLSGQRQSRHASMHVIYIDLATGWFIGNIVILFRFSLA